MLFLIQDFVAGKIGFYYVFEAAVVAEESELDDVAAEFFPLHGLVAIDVDLFEEVDEGEGEFFFEFFVFGVVVEVLEHDGDELIDGEALFLLLEALLDENHFLFVEHLEDLVL